MNYALKHSTAQNLHQLQCTPQPIIHPHSNYINGTMNDGAAVNLAIIPIPFRNPSFMQSLSTSKEMNNGNINN
jgi:hypothetical protein